MGTLAEYIRPEAVWHLAFMGVLILTFGGALVAVLPKSIVHNVFGLAASLTGVAGLFLFLGSAFLAMMELLIYVGAICIAIIFAIMLSQPLHLVIPPRHRPKVIFSFVISFVIFVAFSVIVARTPWESAVKISQDWSVGRLGVLLMSRYELIFEMISLVLLVAIIGAIITAAVLRKQKGEESSSDEGEQEGS